MRILIVSRYKNNFADHQLPFVTEQGTAIAKCLRDMQNDGMSRAGALNEPLTLNDEPVVDYFLVKGNESLSRILCMRIMVCQLLRLSCRVWFPS